MTWYCSACTFYLLPFAGSSLLSDVASSISNKNKGSDSDLRIGLTPVVISIVVVCCHIKKKSLV